MASSRVVFVGRIHDEKGLATGRTDTAQQFEAARCVVALTRGETDDQRDAFAGD